MLWLFRKGLKQVILFKVLIVGTGANSAIVLLSLGDLWYSASTCARWWVVNHNPHLERLPFHNGRVRYT